MFKLRNIYILYFFVKLYIYYFDKIPILQAFACMISILFTEKRKKENDIHFKSELIGMDPKK